MCADGHAGITAATAAAGTGGLLLLLVFPEKERVIFQCLHILCAAQEDISEIRLNGRPVQFAVQFLQLAFGLGEQQERRPVLAQDGRQLLEVTHLEGGHLVQDKYKGDPVLHGKRARGDTHYHGDDGGYHRLRCIVVADCKKFRMFRINQIEVEVIPCQHIAYVLIGGQLRHIVAESGHIGGLCFLTAFRLEVRPRHHGADIVQLQEFLKLSRIGLHHEVDDMRQRATFRELIPKPVRHAVQDAKRARIPFVLFGCGRHQRAQYVLHQLHEHRPVLYIPPVQRIEAVSPVHVREIYIIELMGVSVFPDQVVCSPGIVKILEVIDETGESGPDVLFHQRFAYGFGLAGTGSSIDKEIGEPVIISDNCPVRGVKGEQGFSALSAFCPSFERKTKKYGNDTRKQEPPPVRDSGMCDSCFCKYQQQEQDM